MNLKSILALLVFISILSGCNSDQIKSTSEIIAYNPIDKSLYNKILALDETFFNAYNSCDLEVQEAMYSDDLEFFHDKNGLSTSKEDILEGTKRFICGKVTRELIQGSVEVYPINNYGAVQIGYHKFHNKEEPDAKSIPSKFIAMWHNDDNNWKLAKVISLH
jgi:hypothetical protein